MANPARRQAQHVTNPMITHEVLEAFKACDEEALHAALNLGVWEHSPLFPALEDPMLLASPADFDHAAATERAQRLRERIEDELKSSEVG